MSRDFTPRELHRADRLYGQSVRKLTVRDLGTGKEHVVFDPESDLAKRYPNLCFLFDNLKRIVELPECRLESPTLIHVENLLSEIIRADDFETLPAENGDPLHDTVLKWYLGKLDPYFYYSEHNNQALEETIVNVIKWKGMEDEQSD